VIMLWCFVLPIRKT